ncbi:MAG: sel1 repeat family protein [Bacilli bacterium]|nr:sel1 repeat family protein [Bacilli bacterium]
MFKVDYLTYKSEPVEFETYIDLVYKQHVYPLNVLFRTRDSQRILDEVKHRFESNKLDPKNVYVYSIFALNNAFENININEILDLLEANFINGEGQFESIYADFIGSENYSKCRELLEKAIEKGDPFASMLLANFYTNAPYGNVQDFKKAFEVLSFEYERSHFPQAAYWLGRTYENSLGVARDLNKAFDYYTEASNGKCKDATYHLAVIASNSDREDSQEHTLKLLETAAVQGSREAMSALAQAYFEGSNELLKQDYNAAFFYATRGARLGDLTCSLIMAECFEKGYATKKDPEIAKQILIDLTNKGSTEAATKLALLLDSENNEDKNVIFQLLAKSTSLGDENALFWLNEFYNNKNYGTKEEYEKAINDFNNINKKE